MECLGLEPGAAGWYGHGAMAALTFFVVVFQQSLYEWINIKVNWGAAIAQWIRLHLPSCSPGF